MKVTELRIGNLFSKLTDGIGGKFWLKRPVKAGDLMMADLNSKEYKPIPLTEEWLLKFGFEHRATGWHKDKLILLTQSDSTFLVGRLSVGFRNLKCEYVHQLQNLYHALTGEELTIKETVNTETI